MSLSFGLRLGPTCSFEITETMVPRKRRRTVDASSSETKTKIVKNEPSASSDTVPDYGENWRDQCITASAKYHYILRKNILADITFEVGSSKARIQGHRLILALGSPVFEAMFFGALPEKGDTVSIPDVDPEGFEYLLRFLYTDSVAFPNDTVAFKTYFAADKYCITGLKKQCETFLCNSQVTGESVWAYLESSLLLNSAQLTEHCARFLCYSIDEALMHKNFLDVNCKTVEALLCLEGLDITEEKLIRRILEWAKHQQLANPDRSIKDILQPLLKHMRMGALTGDEFVCLRKTTQFRELLSDQDALAILEHICSPRRAALPRWCSLRTTSRTEDLVASKKRTHDAKLKEAIQSFRKRMRKPVFVNSSDMSSSSSSSSSFSETSSSDSEM